ncbi:hypothetical protein BDZ97DRAFT_1762362 [Flammula alnicola]|nr:hypothetical protein BDZ97DRAFT_1762362 [Flammula alnicola]
MPPRESLPATRRRIREERAANRAYRDIAADAIASVPFPPGSPPRGCSPATRSRIRKEERAIIDAHIASIPRAVGDVPLPPWPALTDYDNFFPVYAPYPLGDFQRSQNALNKTPTGTLTVYLYKTFQCTLKLGPLLPERRDFFIFDESFLYSDYSELSDIVDHTVHAIEYYHVTRGWTVLDLQNHRTVTKLNEVPFMILRCRDHPGGTNVHCIGLAELLFERDLYLAYNPPYSRHRHAEPSGILPDARCPPDTERILQQTYWETTRFEYGNKFIAGGYCNCDNEWCGHIQRIWRPKEKTWCFETMEDLDRAYEARLDRAIRREISRSGMRKG